MDINDIAMMSAFTILNDDTFLISYMPPLLNENKRLRISRSTDLGKTWQKDVYVLAHWGTGGYGGYLTGSTTASDGKIITACVTWIGPIGRYGKITRGLRFHAITWQPLAKRRE